MSAPVAIVLNRRYVPPTANGPYKVGAAHFSLVAAQALSEASCFLGFLLYRRRDRIIAPVISCSKVLGYLAYNIDLAFSLKIGEIRSALQTALDQLTVDAPDGSISCDQTPILYYQTDVLLAYSPSLAKSLVTHHGPFISDVVGLVGEGLAREAFRGGKEKILYLGKAQRAGFEILRHDPNCYALEHSPVQVSSLLARGIPEQKILRVAPPTVVQASCGNDEESLPKEVKAFLNRIGSALLLMTAVARIDTFKNIGLLVDAAIQLKNEGADIAVLVAGDANTPDAIGNPFADRIPSSQRDSFLFVESLLRNQMLNVFSRVRDVGIFVLPSVFETFGFTPLEAMCCGLTTIVSDCPRWIGVAEYVPKHLRFAPSTDGLVKLVRSFLSDRSMLKEGVVIARDLQARVGYQYFKKDLLRAVTTVGESKTMFTHDPRLRKGQQGSSAGEA